MGKKSKEKKQVYVSIDLGTANTLVNVGGDVVFNERSVIAYDVRRNRVHSIGDKAFTLAGKEHRGIRISSPLEHGVISDIEATTDYLEYVFLKLKNMDLVSNSILLLACPSMITEIERDALIDIAASLGVQNVYIEEEVKMAALGCGVDITLPEGNLIIDMGGGTTDVAIIASGDIIDSKSIKIAGNFLNNEIANYVRAKHNLAIGQRMSEKIKKDIGSAYEYEKENPMFAHGRNLSTGLPSRVEVTPLEIRNILISGLDKVVDIVNNLLESAPAEISADLIENGITICGGGALIRNIDKYFSGKFSVPVRVGRDPLLGVINGTVRYEDHIRLKLLKDDFGVL